jgi:chromosome segregation ATPase
MTKLELLKLKSQLASVEAGKAEQEFQLEQKKEEIVRLEKALEVQEEKIKELKNLLKE